MGSSIFVVSKFSLHPLCQQIVGVKAFSFRKQNSAANSGEYIVGKGVTWIQLNVTEPTHGQEALDGVTGSSCGTGRCEALAHLSLLCFPLSFFSCAYFSLFSLCIWSFLSAFPCLLFSVATPCLLSLSVTTSKHRDWTLLSESQFGTPSGEKCCLVGWLARATELKSLWIGEVGGKTHRKRLDRQPQNYYVIFLDKSKQLWDEFFLYNNNNNKILMNMF